MRILWYSNAPWTNTGYGTQTAQVVRRLKAAGHEVIVANNHGLYGLALEWEGVQVLSSGADSYSRDALLGWAEQLRPDWILTLFDVWVFQPREVYAELPIASWVPVDSNPIPRDVLAWCKEHEAIAMSKYGLAQMEASGVKAHYAPHAIDTSVYRAIPSDFRHQFNVPEDAFLVLINAANKGKTPSRKAWPQMIFAFAEFARRHPDAYLFLNTDIMGMFDGVPLPALMKGAGVPEDRIRAVPDFQYRSGQVTENHMAAMYAACDVLLSTSMGEGFGLAVIEAQACGLPVIVTDFTAQPELVGAGWTVGWQPEWHQGMNTTWAMPLISDIIDRLELAYEAKGDQALRAKAVEFAKQYDADRVFAENWRPILDRLEGLRNPKLTRQQRRAAERKSRKAA